MVIPPKSQCGTMPPVRTLPTFAENQNRSPGQIRHTGRLDTAVRRPRPCGPIFAISPGRILDDSRALWRRQEHPAEMPGELQGRGHAFPQAKRHATANGRLSVSDFHCRARSTRSNGQPAEIPGSTSYHEPSAISMFRRRHSRNGLSRSILLQVIPPPRLRHSACPRQCRDRSSAARATARSAAIWARMAGSTVYMMMERQESSLHAALSSRTFRNSDARPAERLHIPKARPLRSCRQNSKPGSRTVRPPPSAGLPCDSWQSQARHSGYGMTNCGRGPEARLPWSMQTGTGWPTSPSPDAGTGQSTVQEGGGHQTRSTMPIPPSSGQYPARPAFGSVQGRRLACRPDQSRLALLSEAGANTLSSVEAGYSGILGVQSGN